MSTALADSSATKPLTIIEFSPGITVGELTDRESLYYLRVTLDVLLRSTMKFDKVSIRHLGFHSYKKGKRDIKRKDDGYHSGVFLMPNCSAYITLTSLALTLENIGDSFLRVNVRLPAGVERCKMTIPQRDKPSKDVGDFVQIGQIWYATAIISGIQRLLIEIPMEGQ